MQEGVHWRKPTNPSPVVVLGNLRKEISVINFFECLDQAVILVLHPIEERIGQWPFIAEFLSDMSEIHSRHKANFLLALSNRYFERLEKSRYPWHGDRWSVTKHHVVKGRDQDRHDGKWTFVAKDILEKQGLKLQ